MYDMDGLAMYDDGMGNWITPEMLKQHLMAGAAGGAGILLTAKVIEMIPWDDMLPATTEASTKRYLKLATAGVVGVLGGRLIFDRDRDAAMGFVGGVTGMALAQLVSGLVPVDSEFQLPASFAGGFAGANVSRYDLAALESAVSSSGPAFSPASFQGTAVTERALSAPGVTSEVLAEYAPYLS